MADHLLPLALLLLFLFSLSYADLRVDYYDKSCPNLQKIITDIVTTKQTANPTTAAGILRVFFHDCFVGGCDASVLIASNHFNHAELDADINHSLPGDAFDVIVKAKTALELQCPNTVSCADIMAVTMRDLVVLLGGPVFQLRLGRKDALHSTTTSVKSNLPMPNMTMDNILSMFNKKGFSVQETVALLGAHTVGFSHCKEFADRVFKKHGSGMHPKYAEGLKKACRNYMKDETIAAFNDVMSPGKFDNMYYKNLMRGLGLLESDSALAADPRTRPFVELYAGNQSVFFKDFGHAMQKLSLVGVKTGSDGEVRRRCDQFNELDV